ncbi:MAG: hypothetical protein ACLUI3_05355 [Christensenellales bacterium]
MMNKQIRRMIDEIFADMKMTADNLALRDEMMANAQARFEDSVRAGKTEEGGFRRGGRVAGRRAEPAARHERRKAGRRQRRKRRKDRGKETAKAERRAPDFEVRTEKRRISATCWARPSARWATWAKQIVPQAQKLVRQVDELTGGMIGGIGRRSARG